MKKKKIIYQIIGATLILTVLLVGKTFDKSVFGKIYNFAIAQIMNEITVDEMETAGKSFISTMKKTPTKVVSAIMEANEQSKYASPIDEKASDTVKHVHASSGGMVLKVGNSKELGLNITLKHENAISTYGHLSDIIVMPKERIQRGEIIGSYDESCGEEFYYELADNL